MSLPRYSVTLARRALDFIGISTRGSNMDENIQALDTPEEQAAAWRATQTPEALEQSVDTAQEATLEPDHEVVI